jgi:small subunit ribosomal protein S24e
MVELEITSQKDNKFFDRTEVQFRLTHAKEVTPKRELVREKLATTLNCAKDKVVVDHMESVFGNSETKGYAKVYKSVDKLRSVESDYILKRNNLFIEKPKKEVKEKPKKEKKKE